MTERFNEVTERIREIPEELKTLVFSRENGLSDRLKEYFSDSASFLTELSSFYREFEAEDLVLTERIEELKRWNTRLYHREGMEEYADSLLCPGMARKKLGVYAPLFSALLTELHSLIPAAYEKREERLSSMMELFLQIYCMFSESAGEEQLPKEEYVRDAFYSYFYDNAELLLRESMEEQYDPAGNLLKRVMQDADLSGADYLYRTGEYVSEETLLTAETMGKLSEEEIDRMARPWYEGFRDGFLLQRKPYRKKSLTELCFAPGFERVARQCQRYFRKDHYDVTIPRENGGLLFRLPAGTAMYHSVVNRQLEEDHAYDMALLMGDRLKVRLLDLRRALFREMNAVISRYAGPTVMEVFGEAAFSPKEEPAALRFTAHQKSVYGEYRRQLQQMVHEFILEEERSFTIIAWPLPACYGRGAEEERRYRELLERMIRINTMPKERYEKIQGTLIAALDQAEYVQVLGKGNDTDIRVSMQTLQNPEKQSNFENCLSDVNVPLGEVFTSPKLEGTNGILHVRSVYIQGIHFRDLFLRFSEGRVTEYRCGNFEDTEKGKALIRKQIFQEQEHLPLGEFAIGTNTLAYQTAEDLGLGSMLPILIAEKTGPHFAVGDTCYSFMEDMQFFNPDGKELTAKDNSVTLQRKTDPEKAYFAVHTDITIPYRELGKITAVRKDGSELVIFAENRFVLPGTEELNEAFGDMP